VASSVIVLLQCPDFYPDMFSIASTFGECLLAMLILCAF